MSATFITQCRSCGGDGLHSVLALGDVPLANALIRSDQLGEPEESYSLELVFCPHCTLLQITATVSPDRLFREYFYLSSFSDTALLNARTIADRIMTERKLDAHSLVIEVASNDGYLLRNYMERGIPVLGIEPARNIARLAVDRGVRTLCDFFGVDMASRLAADGHCADVLHANNVLAHVPDLNGFVAGISKVLKPSGVAVIEVPYTKDMIAGCEFDTIYHEHLCYFSLSALVSLFRRNGLVVTDVEHIPIHGGSLRVFASRTGEDVKPAVAQMLDSELQLRMDSVEFYNKFGMAVSVLKRNLIDLLRSLKMKGSRLAAYGASAKGTTLLNYCGIGSDILDFVVDRSTAKQGMCTPGTHLEILPPSALLERMPDYTLLLTWNFAEEIMGQQKDYLSRGGHFIVPIPELRVV